MVTVLHASDLHFGKPFDAEVAGVLRETIQAFSPDVLVFSGDFTQRAKIREFQEARDFLKSLPDLPTVVTPGNHDVPLYRVGERLLAPRRNYLAHISSALDSTTRVRGATFVSLDSTAPRRAIVNGHLHDRQLRFAAEAFGRAPDGDARVVVLHHHLAPAPDFESDQVLSGYQRVLRAFEAMGVDLILGGHLHRAYVADSRDAWPGGANGRRMIIAHSGTTTSTRGRARERNKNSFNLIGIAEGEIEITHFQFNGNRCTFDPVRAHRFPRGSCPALGHESPEMGDEE